MSVERTDWDEIESHTFEFNWFADFTTRYTADAYFLGIVGEASNNENAMIENFGN